MKFSLFLVATVVSLASSLFAATSSLQLTLPKACYAVPGVPMSIYYDNVVLTETPENYRFEITSKVGHSEAKRWTFTAEAKHVGQHALSLAVKDAQGKILERAQTTLHVVPANAGADRSLRLLIVGDSLTNATLYPNQIARRLSLPGNPPWKMLGTHQTVKADPGVFHEGYGGWRWTSFLTLYAPEAERTLPSKGTKRNSSPFLYPGAEGKGQLDLARYIREEGGNQPPDVVTFLLGINDCFSANPEDPAAVEASIEAALGHAEKLLKAFHAAAPKAVLAVGLTTPPNAREAGFQASYKGRYHRWGWKRIHHRLVQRMLQQFSGREAEGIHLVPTELNLDPVAGYPEDNGVHPNPTGYEQIGDSFYAWIKWWLQTSKA